ncbi:LPS-assembly lipoprotein [Loktanella sp. DSM 29012]|uniref:hypothetical protein n=1 Tax=Loktanella sp. DSM 29012 TaxID=1881056 RepID=UPI0008CC7D63|nr:hypothetical protein [Loktanella sp. DSM 29012]SEP64421.1 LPS-assembly lipoprotein [Loktanella sp. DSM 29012]
MSSEGITRRAALLAVLALGACGFTPVLAPGGTGDALRGQVVIEAPRTIAGFAVRSRLVDRLGDGAGPYRLSVSLDRAQEAAALSTGGDILRYNVVGAAGWALTDAEGTRLGDGQVDAFTSYAATGSTVATQTAATDANGRLMILLADRIVADIYLLDLAR